MNWYPSPGGGVPSAHLSAMGHSGPDWVAALFQDSHFHKILENGAVIVWQLKLHPGESTLLDRYGYDFLEVVIQSGSMSMADELGHATPLPLRPGVRLIRGGFAQVLKNTDEKTPFYGVLVEFRSPLGAERCGPEAPVLCPSGGDFSGTLRHHALGIVETAHLCGRRYLMGTRLCSPVLIVAIQPARLVTSSGSIQVLDAGQAAWLTSGEESMQATASSAIVDFVGIEFKEGQQFK